MKASTYILIIALHLVFSGSVQGQTQSDTSSPNYQLRFLRAKFTDKENKKNMLAMFQLLPINLEEFPPMFEPEMTYSIDGGPLKKIDARETKVSVNLVVSGNNLKEKDSSLYEFVKHRLIENNTEYFILAFYINNISEHGFKEMTMTYGLREKNNSSIRAQQKFDFTVEK